MNTRPKTYMLESILVTLFCCLPFGIVGIVFASKVNSLYDAGNIEMAYEASKSAGKWTMWGFICGIISSVINVLLNISEIVALITL